MVSECLTCLLEWFKMRSHGFLLLVVLGLAFSSAQELSDKGNVPSVRLDGSRRPLTDVGYLRYGNPFVLFSNGDGNGQNSKPQNPTETNELGQDEERRPYFLIRTLEPFRNSAGQQQSSADSDQVIGIRKKRDVEADIPESSKVGKLRKKRTYCNKCGGGYGGYGGYSYRPVTYAVYPVYTAPVYTAPTYSYPVYSGGGKGCNVCGGGGGGGGFSGSYSQSSSSSHSSSGSWGYGK